LVAAVLVDSETSKLSDADKALFRFVRKVNENSVAIGPPDIALLHEAGFTDEAIYYAITVCSLLTSTTGGLMRAVYMP
jgi:hypothetical protein